jgi:nucleoside-diphosphate-sugar epimerase
MKIFMTGGTGFIGSHLAEKLIEEKHDVTCLVRNPEKLRYLEGLPVNLITTAEFEKTGPSFFADMDAVIHLAGVTKGVKKEDYYNGNVKMTLNLMKKLVDAGYRRRFIILGSQAAAGPSDGTKPVKIDDPPNPLSWYGESKLQMEKAVKEQGKEICWTILRPTAVFGPRDTDMYMAFKMSGKGFNLQINGKDDILSIIYVKDLVKAIIMTLHTDKDICGKVYFVGNPEPVTVSYLQGLVAKYFGKSLRNIYIPAGLIKIAGWYYELTNPFRKKPNILNRQKVNELLPDSWICDTKTFAGEIGFSPDYSLEEAVRETLNWYVDNGWL